MLALLVALTAAVVLVPMLPALIEWLHPSDVVPLPIDESDALDPSFLARRFAEMRQQARLSEAHRLGQSELVRVSCTAGALPWPLPLSLDERRLGASRRVWDIAGHVVLPEGIGFLSEVAAAGDLRTATGGTYRALWSGATLHLSATSSVMRWAHGREVFVGAGSALAGRVTAARTVTLKDQVSFTLLHAPTIQCQPPLLPLSLPPSFQGGYRVPMTAWPADLAWDTEQRRGFGKGPVVVPANRAFEGDLIAVGDIVLGANCHATGSLKSHGALRLGAGCRISGSVFAAGVIHFAGDCMVGASVVSETAIVLGPHCRIGSPSKWATVAAPDIEIDGGVAVHGTIWAGQRGWTRSGGQQAESLEPVLQAPLPKGLPRHEPVEQEERALA